MPVLSRPKTSPSCRGLARARYGVTGSSRHSSFRSFLGRRVGASPSDSSLNVDVETAEITLLGMLDASRKPEQENDVLRLIAELENEGSKSDNARALDPKIDGEWTLIYSTKSQFDPRNPLGSRVDGTAPLFEGILRDMLKGVGAGNDDQQSNPAASASPIQRTVLSSDFVVVTQDVSVNDATSKKCVDQTVSLAQGKVTLKLSAIAEKCEGDRIDFRFDEAFFDFNGFRVPYPVPFRLLGDEARGWLDTTYLSDNLRISKGNKGTTFVLKRR